MFERNLVETCVAIIQMIVGIHLFTGNFVRRKHALWKPVLGGLIPLLVLTAVLFSSDLVASMGPNLAKLWEAIVSALFWSFALLPAAMLVTGLRETGFWPAVFCTVAGYTLQNLASSMADSIELALGNGNVNGVPLAPTVAIEVTSCVIVYLVAWPLLARPVRESGLAASSDRRTLVLLAMVFFAVILFDTINKSLATLAVPLSLLLALKLIHGIVCVALLVMGFDFLVGRRAREEAALAESMLAAERRQYQLSRENIEAINVKCHDIRHQIRHLADGGTSVTQQALDELSSEIDVYDSLVKTGNDALDTILSEKGLICERRGIPFRCIADGTAVSFMQLVDIYALFGNAVENAIEASERLPQDQRDISLMVRKAAGTASIHVENRFAGNVSFRPDGLPRTTKADSQSHGFGTRSIRLIAERYGGSVAMRAKDGVFHLNVVIPLPE